MANATNGRVWILDTVGLISASPVAIEKIVLYPSSAADAATLKYANFGSATTKSTADAATATVSSNALTSTGNFTSAKVAAGDGITITYTSTGKNVGNYYVVSRDSDNAVTLSYATMTDEASKKYSWKVYESFIGAQLTSYGTEKVTEETDFGGKVFPSLILSAISSGAKVYVYIA